MIYRVTIYENEKKDFEEFEDEDDLRDHLNDCQNDLEKGSITSYVVSRIHGSHGYEKPFWEKE